MQTALPEDGESVLLCEGSVAVFVVVVLDPTVIRGGVLFRRGLRVVCSLGAPDLVLRSPLA
ncbi:hypothetical protein, partial [Microbacterium sp. GbtcB4]|uniref:hypothetical protein n=1 Tax=Microbacterium sp. GbtcB4 TaxID=2824749 RepID=UPI001C30F482